MEYWHDMMNWPLTPGWKCEICGYDPPWGTGLTWGLVNGVCRCDRCHVEYTMKREDEVTDTMWDRYLSAAELPAA